MTLHRHLQANDSRRRGDQASLPTAARSGTLDLSAKLAAAVKGMLGMMALALLLTAQAPAVSAAVIHLHTGESLNGRIQQMDDQTLSLESQSGFGVLQIERSQIRMIEFDDQQRDLSRKFGLGYYQRGVALNGQGGAREFSVGNVSLKYWLNQADAVELLVGYSSTVDGGDKLLEIFNLELRYAKVLVQEANENLYWGASGGYISVVDETEQIDDTGFSFRAFLGIEIFLNTLPNLGISAEIGAGTQTIGDRSSFSIFNAGFPTLAVRYYF